MRVIAGSARGHRLEAPPGRDVRPTADRVREALFSSLAPVVPGARVLDLFAGSGALAIEALSRGASSATMVERDRRAVSVVASNLARTGLADRALLLREDAKAFAAHPRGGPFDLVFADPPYGHPLPGVYALLAALHVAGGLAPAATVVVERDRRGADLDTDVPGFLTLDGRRGYGDTVLLYLRSRVPPDPRAAQR